MLRPFVGDEYSAVFVKLKWACPLLKREKGGLIINKRIKEHIREE